MKTIATAILLMSLSSATAIAGDLSTAQASQMHDELSSAMQTMHDDMHKGMMSNNPDIAFAAGMLPHHVGAVEMAKIELKYGTDPQMRQLAKSIIALQEKEIKEMQIWLKSHAQPNVQLNK